MNIYALNVRVSQYIKQRLTEMKVEIDNIIIISISQFEQGIDHADRKSTWKCWT